MDPSAGPRSPTPGPRLLQPSIRGHIEATARRQARIRGSPILNTITGDIPVQDQERVPLISRLFSAVFNLHNVLEKRTAVHYRLFEGDRYTSEDTEILCWDLLSKIEDAQRGVCHIPPWMTAPQSLSYQVFGSFSERFNAVENALKESKAISCSVFSQSDFSARLAWNPGKELSRKKTNQRLNTMKTNSQAVGNAMLEGEDLTRNEDGDLTNNKTGKVFLSKRKISESVNQGAKKKPRLSSRINTAARAVDPPQDMSPPLPQQPPQAAQGPDDVANELQMPGLWEDQQIQPPYQPLSEFEQAYLNEFGQPNFPYEYDNQPHQVWPMEQFFIWPPYQHLDYANAQNVPAAEDNDLNAPPPQPAYDPAE